MSRAVSKRKSIREPPPKSKGHLNQQIEFRNAGIVSMTEMTELSGATWRRACEGPTFTALRAQRSRTVLVLMAICLTSYLGLAVLCGFFRELMGMKVLGPLNLGYSLILANYVMVWVLGVYYLNRSSATFDVLASTSIEESGVSPAPNLT
jgi:uncharacterized membrane protein (DUF485 family)